MDLQDREWDRQPGLFARKIRGIAHRQLGSLLGGRYSGRNNVARLDDTLQDVMCWLWKNNYEVLRRWDTRRGVPFEGYVAVVVRHRALSLLRRERSHSQRQGEELSWDELPAHGTPADDFESRDLTRKLVLALQERLSGKGYRIFEVLFLDETSIEEAEEILGMSRAALYQWRLRLRRELQDIVGSL